MSKDQKPWAVSDTIWNQLNAKKRNIKGIEITDPSITVPDQTITMREMINKHAKGLPIDVVMQGTFEEEGEETQGINPKTLDFVDIQELQLSTKRRIQELEDEISETKVVSSKKRKLEAIQALKTTLREEIEKENKDKPE